MDPTDPLADLGQIPGNIQPAAPEPDDKQELPKRPEIPSNVRAFVKKWWGDTANVPDHDAAVRAARECQKTLFPAWFDRSDRYRGMAPQELRTRSDDRRVRTNLAYRNVLQTVAMTVPDDHGMRWEPIQEVGAETGPLNPAHQKMAETLVPVVQAYLNEANWQETIQACVQDACQYRLGVLKIVFDRDFTTDTLKGHAENRDQQDNVQRLRVLLEDYNRKVFTQDSEQYKELITLKDSLGLDGELKVWSGIRTELVPIDCFKFDPAVRNFEQIYRASWMSHDVMMSVEEIRSKYPFKLLADGDWEGVHPNDLTTQNRLQTSGTRPSNDTFYGTSREKGKGPNPIPDSTAEMDRVLVREVWARSLNRVFVLVDGVEYPVASWVPKNTPAQWYPFRLLRLNRVTGQIYGISDVELQREIQLRINRKRTDEEKARWLSLPRGIYNTQGIDQAEVNKMRDHNPGEWKGLNLGSAKSIKEVMEFQQFNFTPESFNTAKDEQDMAGMSCLPIQMTGVTGQAKYSSEVEAATQGAAISANARGTIIRRFLEGTYDMVAEILLQELTQQEAQDFAGPLAFWPHIYSEAEAMQVAAALHKQVDMKAQATLAQAAMTPTLPAAPGMPPGPPAPPPPQTLIDEMRSQEFEQACMATFGWTEPVSREVILRRLRCKVTVALNTQADRAQRVQAIQSICSSIQMLAQAAQSAGKILNIKPFLKAVQPVFGADIALTEMFQDPPPMAPGAIGAPAGQPGLPPAVAGAMAPQTPPTTPAPGKGNVVGAPESSTNTAIAPVAVPGVSV
jgi:hypothetical protein